MENIEIIEEINQIMTVSERTEAKTSPDEKADNLTVFEENAPVLIVGEIADNWYQITYRGEYGYIKKDAVTAENIDVAALNEEMIQNEEESQMMVEEIERYRSDTKSSRIWGSVIVLLVVGIFVAGFFSSKEAKPKKKRENTSELELIDLDEINSGEEKNTNETDHTDPVL